MSHEHRRRYVLPHQYWASDEAIKVDQFTIEGQPRHTADDVFELYLAKARASTSANELHQSLMEAHDRLMQLGVFKSVRFVVDSARQPHHTNIAVVPVEEKRKEYAVGVAGGGTDPVVFTGSFALQNAFGRAEHFRVGVSHTLPGAEYKRSFDVAFRKPLLFATGPWEKAVTAVGRYGTTAHVHDSKHTVEQFHESAAYQQRLGATASAWRAVHEVSRIEPAADASFANLEQGGWNAKAALAYDWAVDTRDSTIAPTTGTLRKATVELAVDPHKVQPMFAKLEVAANTALPVPQLDATLLLRVRGGHMVPLRGRGEPEHASPSFSSVDAFHIGGAPHVPGFQARGIGRTQAHESLGSATYWLASAHFVTGLGGMMPPFLKWQLHASACGVSDVIGAGAASPQGVQAAFGASALRASVGLGLVAAVPGMGRVTLTYSRILRDQLNDDSTSYIQVGFATSFD